MKQASIPLSPISQSFNPKVPYNVHILNQSLFIFIIFRFINKIGMAILMTMTMRKVSLAFEYIHYAIDFHQSINIIYWNWSLDEICVMKLNDWTRIYCRYTQYCIKQTNKPIHIIFSNYFPSIEEIHQHSVCAQKYQYLY